MTKQLVFIHGRSQQHKDSIALKAEWIDAFEKGLAKNNLPMPVTENDIRFPYYGQTLFDLVDGADDGDAADIIVRGTAQDDAQKAFFQAVFEELRERENIDEAKLQAVAGAEVVQRGPLEWEWLQGILKAVDTYVPGASGASIALATSDVYQYMKNQVIYKTINDGVRKAITPGVQTVVVSHSLGTVVAYNLLNKDVQANEWEIPLFVTLGSPLGVKAIRKTVRPIAHPACADKWFNAMDERDIVALYPLDDDRFDVDPSIENKTDVDNPTPNRHGISGYLSDADVAAKIYAALTT
ncbi:MAG: alpha/beta hydrolase [Candidatus Thiodiazotropha sp. (ex Notomyrtea botanica)]|nr:alpha/beta hydrolase [Candidatus Thiodiazotropha sp. (ex Notomyrtea botanica)]